MYGRTDARTDGRTDGQTHSVARHTVVTSIKRRQILSCCEVQNENNIVIHIKTTKTVATPECACGRGSAPDPELIALRADPLPKGQLRVGDDRETK